MAFFRNKEFARFLVVGVINTLIGYGAFLFFAEILHIHPSFSNAAAYAIAISVAYVLYRDIVFSASKSKDRRRPLRFAISVAIAFALNQLVLFGLIKTPMPIAIAQLFAMATYTISFFFLNKFLVFGHSN